MTEYKYYTNNSIKATTGLVAAYSFSKDTVSNGTLLDISGNQNHGSINGALLSKDGMKFDGDDDYISLPNSVDCGINSTICIRFKSTDTDSDRQILGESSYVADWVISMTGGSSILYRVGSNVDSINFTYSANRVYNLVISRSGSSANLYINGFYIGEYTGFDTSTSTLFDTIGAEEALLNFFGGEIYDFKAYNYAFTEAEAKAYHNSFIKPTLLEDFSGNGIDNKPKGWQEVSGEFEVKELTEQDTVLKDLEIGTKYLECTSKGITDIQSKQAYGEWEFRFSKGASGAGNSHIIAQSPSSPFSGYHININSGNLQFVKTNPTKVLFRAENYISNHTWYIIKVARLKSKGTFERIVPSMTTTYPADTFAVFIKGGDFGNNWTLVDTTNGAGSNPVTDSTYTTSNYFVANFDKGDKITKIKIYDGVRQ